MTRDANARSNLRRGLAGHGRLSPGQFKGDRNLGAGAECSGSWPSNGRPQVEADTRRNDAGDVGRRAILIV
ncbi:hypothetical protein I551_8576 [Mycobacterium ulcerans str. Harvey]|uniref:Uncharacterized protein n=1 Tax=Mycobacterium ulcerans str. Harvey TaxID=1299332 RepID=A0ABP3AST0_MYCUL|nr:hypothetical protein I551_8576 [Mycobacterium ulcerans str. Harvey]